MTPTEMLLAADDIGLCLKGQRVQLLAVNEERGIARIVRGNGTSIEVRVSELTWKEPA